MKKIRVFFLLIYCLSTVSLLHAAETSKHQKIVELSNKGSRLIPTNPEKALEYFNQVIALDPSARLIYLLRSHALMNLKRYPEAIEDTLIAEKRSPTNENLAIFRGLMLDALGEKEKADKAYERGVSIHTMKLKADPDNLYLRAQRAELYYLLGKIKLYQDEINSVENKDPQDWALMGVKRTVEEFEKKKNRKRCDFFNLCLQVQ